MLKFRADLPEEAPVFLWLSYAPHPGTEIDLAGKNYVINSIKIETYKKPSDIHDNFQECHTVLRLKNKDNEYAQHYLGFPR